MPHDVALPELLPTDIDPADLNSELPEEPAPQDQGEHRQNPSILAQMEKAGRKLVRAARRVGPKGLLAAMITAGAALVSPQAMDAQVYTTYNYIGNPASYGDCQSNKTQLGRIYANTPCANGVITASVTFNSLMLPSPSLQTYTGFVDFTRIASYTLSGFSTDPLTSMEELSTWSGFQFVNGAIEQWFLYSGVGTGGGAQTQNANTFGNSPPFNVSDFAISQGRIQLNLNAPGNWSLATGTPILPKSLGNPVDVSCPCDDATGKPLTQVADPITVSTGNVFESITDYKTAGQNPLGFTRYYNSLMTSPGVGTLATSMSPNWRSSYDRYLNLTQEYSSPAAVTAERPDGQMLTFARKGSTWTSDTDVDMTLSQNGSTWTLTDHNDNAEIYSDSGGGVGFLTSITARNGYTQNISYNTNNQIDTVTDSYNRSLGFSYDANQHLQSVTTPDGLVISYGYSSTGVLSSASYNTTPATRQTYVYEISNRPLSLTGIIDENSNRTKTWGYDAYGRGASYQSGGSLGADAVAVAFNSDGTTTVTNAFGVADTYTFQTLQGVQKVTQISRAATSTTAAATRTFGYDTNGYLNNETDWNGNQTTLVNNAQGNPTTINEAVGSSVARTTAIAYDSTWTHLPATITTSGLTTNFTYDGGGNPLTRTDTDTTSNTTPYRTNGQTRTTTWTWNSTGEETSVQLPRTDATVKTSFGYDGTGAMTSITDPLGHVTHITSHTGGGYPTTIVDPNGVTTTLGWDTRLNLNTVTVATTAGNLTTTYTHDAANNLTAVQLPDGAKLTYTRDAANRVTGVTDLQSNRVGYNLDALGDVTQVQFKNSTWTLKWQDSATFDALGRELTNTNGGGFATKFTWDANGNMLTRTPPSSTTTFTYDALNRVATKIDPTGGGTTTFTLDAHDRLTNVQDPKGNNTTYTRDGFGETVQLVSPDTGTSVYTFDKDSNMTQKVLAGGQTANLTYDANDRNLTVSYPADSTLNIAKTYDQAGHGFGIGRLTSVTDQVGSDSFTWDERGNITNESRTVTGAGTLNTATGYDKANRVASIGYPSGTVVNYARDSMGNVSAITAQPPGASSPSNVATGIAYAPFGPVTALTFGNGIAGSNTYDYAYRQTAQVETGTAGPVQNFASAYFANDTLFWTKDYVNRANDISFNTPDGLDRATGAASGSGGFGTYVWSWDANSNLYAQTTSTDGYSTFFQYTAGTNRLAQFEKSQTTAYTTIATTPTGNISTITAPSGAVLDTLTYNAADRLSSALGSLGSYASYKYGFDGQRIEKAPPGTYPILYQYSRAANELLSENDLHRGQAADYIYMDPGRNSRPIGEVNPTTGTLYFMHTDVRAAPERVTDGNQNVVWTAMYKPFGDTFSFGGTLTTQSLRLPGQQFDPETGFNHNGFRDYAGSLTRYVQSDPIGLGGGMNTYQYVKGSPFKYVDPKGLWPTFLPGEDKAHQDLPPFLQKALPGLTSDQITQLSDDIIDELGSGDLSMMLALRGVKKPCDLTTDQRQALMDFLDRLPTRDKDMTARLKDALGTLPAPASP